MREERIIKGTPESVGISGNDILRFLDELEASGTEMHGIVIMRHGKIAAEGWWQPFAFPVAHSAQSLTKTVTGIAYGIAEKEGILNREEKLIDIFPEYERQASGPYFDELKMKHILTMSAGMEEMPSVKDPDWIRKFFTMRIVHKPGTAFFYNSIACSLVGACICKKTGISLRKYLDTRLFAPLGIQPLEIEWLNHPDGFQNGSGGLLSTTLANAKFLELYRNGGRWGEKEILTADFVKFATTVQNPRPDMGENSGYGGMMWIRNGSYYADGAMGQLAVVFPQNDLTISLHQTVSTGEANKKMSEALFRFGAVQYADRLPEDTKAQEMLEKRIAGLHVPPPCGTSRLPEDFMFDIRFEVMEGRACFFPEDAADIFNDEYHDYLKSITFRKAENEMVRFEIESELGIQSVTAALNGEGYLNRLRCKVPMRDVVVAAYCEPAGRLHIYLRWLGNCRTHELICERQGAGLKLTSLQQRVGGFDREPLVAIARRAQGQESGSRKVTIE